MSDSTLKIAMKKTEENMKTFCATSSYGKLHIDETSGLFAISKDLNKDGKPKRGNNVFSIYDIEDIGLCCKSPRTNHSLIIVDVEFRFTLSNPYFHCSKIIKQGARCKSKRIDSQYVEWEEPGEMVMFRTLFNNMLSRAFERVNSILCGKTVHAFELEKARAIFMLPEDYTVDDLKKARRLMLKVYHPDSGDDVTRESQMINKAYDLLKAELETNDVRR
jgi:hypothetical protein